eukprot:CAMPEP_0116825204 /NCGR_PEP_ID=MMETSP0418-20121206/1828_1 /TAXON_ID=1158023 /ORGANISM="Astrosyne radiata, Strain 13vi08-1A" /LENGTH=300 /DNA_ID=CAMNT_0004453671 /DNA_START=44 /DNA_END=946 /DNA_ORIENTATION=-
MKPSIDAVLDGEVEISLKGVAKAGISKQMERGAAYADGKWRTVDTLTTLDNNLNGVEGLASADLFVDADAGFAFEIEVKVDLVMGVTPSIEAGAYLEFNTVAATDEDPAFYLSKFDIGVYLSFPLEVEIFGISDCFTFATLKYSLITLPNVTLVPKYTNTCKRDGLQKNIPKDIIDTAVYVRFEARSDSTSPISNPMESPIKFDTSNVTSTDSRIKIESCSSGSTCDLVIPRSEVVKGSNDISFRDSVLIVRPSVKYPPVDYVMKADVQLGDIFEKFDCCDSNDCADGEDCDSGVCKSSS